MLSRVADSLYWMSRYIERAENNARIADVNLQLLLDLTNPSEADSQQQWDPIISSLEENELFASLYGNLDGRAVIDFVSLQKKNPNSIHSCLTHARENARTTSEQISSEMWEQINRLYLFVKSDTAKRLVRASPYEFFKRIIAGSHLFQGITDVMVSVGLAMFQRHRTTEEIRTELLARNVRLSASEIDYLGRKFIMYLACAHRQAAPRIREAMILAGGYVLHLDATHEGDAPALMTGLDSLSKIVLANVKIPSEHAEHIVPFLRKIDSTYGTPKACVHDMGTGICKAVAEVFPSVADFICHFHFLRDIGKDFLDPAYRELRNRLRAYSISSRLCALVRKCAKRSMSKLLSL